MITYEHDYSFHFYLNSKHSTIRKGTMTMFFVLILDLLPRRVLNHDHLEDDSFMESLDCSDDYPTNNIASM